MTEKLSVVKVVDGDALISETDLERCHQIGANQLVLIKVGDENHLPTIEDLEDWRKIFEEASFDPDFKIFTHPGVTVEVIDIGKIVNVE